ncbi:hypothetical protein AGMMS49525_08650 [Bacteroidia bacterium]|nr:hypothetical protein AGMMS49525_08650 [Bacteroidia bacterium]
METTVLVKIDDFKSLISNAPAVLDENKASFQGALKKGDELIALAKVKMDDVLDNQLSIYVQRVRTTVKAMEEKRKPFTQIMTAIAKEFTTLESGIKVPAEECQKIRDSYATKKMEERKEQERQAALKIAKANELIDTLASYKIRAASEYSDFLLKIKTKELDWLNNELTLKTIDNAESAIALIGSEVQNFENEFITIPYPMRYNNDFEFWEFAKADKEQLEATYFSQFKEEIRAFKRELIDLLPSKKNQLIEAKKEAERIAAIQDEQAKAEAKAAAEKKAAEESARQADEKARIEAEAKAAQAKAEADANVKAAEQRSGAFVDGQAELFQEAPKTKEGYEIVVKNVAGYMLLVQLWFEREGKTLAPEKIEKMTIERMKTFCEKWALKNDEFIQSDLIEYKTIYKAK